MIDLNGVFFEIRSTEPEVDVLTAIVSLSDVWQLLSSQPIKSFVPKNLIGALIGISRLGLSESTALR